MVDVAVGIDEDLRSGEATTVNEARVVQGVAEDRVAGARQGLDGADIRGVAGREESSGRRTDELGVGVFSLPMCVHGSGDETGGRSANPFSMDRGV